MFFGDFPFVVASNNGTDNTTTTTSATIQLPASIQAGQLLLIFGCLNGAHGAVAITGWTALYDNTGTSGGNVVCLYKIATGSEGATASASWTTARTNKWRSLSIGGWHGTSPPEGATFLNHTSANPDPPALTPSWGATNTLWFAHIGFVNASQPVTAFPANYTTDQYSTTTTGAEVALASRKVNGASENPGTFTLTASGAYDAATVGIRPSFINFSPSVAVQQSIIRSNWH